MVYKSEGLTDNNKIPLSTPVIVENTSARKSLCKFSELLYFKPETAVRKLCDSKSK